jgi:hypothetical protein
MPAQLADAAVAMTAAFLVGWIAHYCVAAIHRGHHHPKGHR